jgi:hypothetical protein
MNLDDDDSSTPPPFEELSNDIPDESSLPVFASTPPPIKMKALFLAFIKETLPELLDRLEREADHLQKGGSPLSEMQSAVLEQEAVLKSEQFTSNAIVRIVEDGYAIVVDGQRISLQHKYRIIFKILADRHRDGNYSFLTAAHLTEIIAKNYREKNWNNFGQRDVMQTYSRMRKAIEDKASSAIIQHNNASGAESGYRLSIPPDNLLPFITR